MKVQRCQRQTGGAVGGELAPPLRAYILYIFIPFQLALVYMYIYPDNNHSKCKSLIFIKFREDYLSKKHFRPGSAACFVNCSSLAGMSSQPPRRSSSHARRQHE